MFFEPYEDATTEHLELSRGVVEFLVLKHLEILKFQSQIPLSMTNRIQAAADMF